jgi:hypothetical protein
MSFISDFISFSIAKLIFLDDLLTLNRNSSYFFPVTTTQWGLNMRCQGIAMDLARRVHGRE